MYSFFYLYLLKESNITVQNKLAEKYSMFLNGQKTWRSISDLSLKFKEK